MMTLCGPTQSGKTYLISEIIKNADTLITPTPTKLVYLYTCYQELYNVIKDHIDKEKETHVLKEYEFIDCNKGIPSISQLESKLGERTLLVLDDLMVISTSDKQNTENLNNIAARDSHHTNTSVIFVCQNLNYGNGKLRNVKINSQYHLLLKNLSDRGNIETLATNRKIPLSKVNEIHRDICKKKYGYVLFDGSPKGYANAQIRTGILPGDDTIIYDINDNTDL